jgi:flagellar basal-body rod protein FlgF
VDRIVFTAMSGAKQSLDQQAVIGNNLANVATSGFRAQLSAMRAVPVAQDAALGTRVSTVATTPLSDFAMGPLDSTGRGLDLAVAPGGWLAVQMPDGTEAYTRRGDLQIDGNGVLTSAGRPVMGQNGPLVVPLGAELFIGNDGVLSTIGLGEKPNALTQLGQIKLVTAGPNDLLRGGDGMFRPLPAADGTVQNLQQDPTVRVQTGVLEGSNVSAVDTMVAMIDAARRYDMQMTVIERADENAQKANALLGRG